MGLPGLVVTRVPSLSRRPLTLTLRISLPVRLIFDFTVVPPVHNELSSPQSKACASPFLQKPCPLLQSGGTGARLPDTFKAAPAGAAVSAMTDAMAAMKAGRPKRERAWRSCASCLMGSSPSELCGPGRAEDCCLV